MTSTKRFSELDATIQNLLKEAVQVRTRAYSPYSKFQVGASVLCEDGTSYPGCNIENAAFTVGICAERGAFAKAISDGKRKFKAVAVAAHQEDSFTTPCGACRQFMSEFSPNLPVYVTKPEMNDVLVTSLAQLLPEQFQPKEDFSFQ